MKCGLLGGKLGHSYSPQIHGMLADYEYRLYEKTQEELSEFLLHSDVCGLNVTIPYKKTVIPFCAELSPRAQRLGAVNTLVRRSDGTLVGHNTDYFGFETLLHHSGLSVSGKKALVLGSGGASATAVAVLQDHGSDVIVISRSGENNYQNLGRHRDAALIVNATPVGMYPGNGAAPLSLDEFPNLEGVLDMVYNPARTALLLQAEERGIPAANGLLMLVAQAKESAEWFLGKPISQDVIPKITRKLRSQMENIILIGMPGSGKTTVSSILLQKTGRKTVDSDEEFLARFGRTPAQTITEDGEAAFRQLESQMLADLGKLSGIVLATGGGCVTISENYPLLHQNGTLFYLQRSLDLLPLDGRPISRSTGVEALFQKRDPLYRQFADHLIDNNGLPEAAADQIMSILGE